MELLAAQQTMESGVDWYQGTADAVRKNRRYLDQPDIDLVLILSGDQLYRMDFREMVRTHKESGAEVTIADMRGDGDDALQALIDALLARTFTGDGLVSGGPQGGHAHHERAARSARVVLASV